METEPVEAPASEGEGSRAVEPALIVTENLSKNYGTLAALRGLSVEVRPGEVFGLLGPNGSGKTTAIRLLLGLLHPTSGRARIAGLDCWRQSLEVRRLVSYLPGELRLFGAMTGLGALKFLSGLRGGVGLDRAVAIAEKVMGLDLRRTLRNYSTGMKQKLALAQSFADPVDILILDEPTSALDPSARDVVLGMVLEARRNRQTVIFSGHVLPEVERVADRVAIMRQGRLLHLEDMHARRLGLRLVLARFEEGVPEFFPEELGLSVRERNGQTVLLEHRGAAAPLLSWLGSSGVADVAIGTDDLKTLYDKYHGAEAVEVSEESDLR